MNDPLPQYDPGSMVVVVGLRDNFNKRTVTVRCRGRSHADKFDTDESHRRAKFRAEVMNVFGIEDDGFHEWCEQQILDQSQSLDAKGQTEIVRPNLTSLESVSEQSTRWFWPPSYMPEGAFTVLDSDPGEGKSTILIDIAARYTRGDSMPPHTAPDDTCEAGNVLLLIGEDDLARTVKPRAVAAGARLDRFHVLRTVSIDGGDEQLVQLPRDIDIIERIIVGEKIGFIGVDVLSCFIESGLSMNDDAHMRTLTTPWANMLERTGATALVLRHLNKKENLRGMYRGGGSIGIIAAARAAFAIAAHPEEPGVRVLAPVKHNLGPRPHSLTYTIEAVGETSRIVWGGQTDLTAADVLNTPRQRGGSKAESAQSIIAGVLASGPRGSNEVEQACDAAGISRSSYWRARKALGVTAEKTDFGGQWLLAMPSANGHYSEEYHDEF